LQKPKISIILPVYNVEKYIAQALNSCINQTLKEIEIIVVDDCGQDESIKIAQNFAKQDNRIKIIHNHKNLKLLKARYEGVKAANAEFIIFLDADDFLDEKICEICFKALSNHQDIDLIVFDYMEQNALNAEFQPPKHPFKNTLLNKQEFLSFLFLGKSINNIAGNVYKRKLYLKVLEKNLKEIPTITHCEDGLLFFTYCLYIKKVLSLDFAGYFYRFNEKSSSRMINVEKVKNIFKDLNFVCEYLNHLVDIAKNLSPFIKLEILNINFSLNHLKRISTPKLSLSRLKIYLEKKSLKYKRRKIIKEFQRTFNASK